MLRLLCGICLWLYSPHVDGAGRRGREKRPDRVLVPRQRGTPLSIE